MSQNAIPAQIFDAAFFGARRAMGPVQLQLVMELDEAFSGEELRRAARAVVRAFPILGCRYVTGAWRDRWQPDPGLLDELVHDVETRGGLQAAMTQLVERELDPASQAPWSITQLRAPEGCRLVVNVLHQLADAAGALAVVGELVRHLAGEDQPLPDGGDRGFGQLLRAVRLRQLPVLAWETLQQLLMPLKYLSMGRTLLPPGALDGGSARVWRSVQWEIGPAQPFRARLRALGCTVNDGLLALLAQLNAALSGPGRLGCFFTVDMRRMLADARPRISNLSGIDVVLLPREAVGGFDETARASSALAARRKQRFPGLPAVLANHSLNLCLPHGLLRRVIRLWIPWATALLNRGLLVTNVGAIDRYLEPLGSRVRDASLLGPWVRGLAVPVITATSFRDRLTLNIHGFQGSQSSVPELFQAQLDELLGLATGGRDAGGADGVDGARR